MVQNSLRASDERTTCGRTRGQKPKPISRAMQGGSELLHVDLQGNTKVLWKSAAQSSPGLPPPDGRYLAIYDSKLSMNIWLMENF